MKFRIYNPSDRWGDTGPWIDEYESEAEAREHYVREMQPCFETWAREKLYNLDDDELAEIDDVDEFLKSEIEEMKNEYKKDLEITPYKGKYLYYIIETDDDISLTGRMEWRISRICPYSGNDKFNLKGGEKVFTVRCDTISEARAAEREFWKRRKDLEEDAMYC